MFSFRVSTILLVAVFGSVSASLRSRRLSFQSIAGYQPESLVTDHNAIDLDQAALEVQIALATDQSFGIARDIYTNGAHSRSLATVNLSEPLTSALDRGTTVSGRSEDDVEIVGIVWKDTPAGSNEIDIQYDVKSIQEIYVGCRVGANPDPFTDGCFAASGDLTIGGETFSYTYDILTNNWNGRTLQGFSLQAEEKMYRCENCPYETYKKFYEYYGQFDYANQWVLAAFDGRATSFANGNADFSGYSFTGKGEAIKKGTAYMNVWMYVIREMEDAIDDCKSDCDIDSCNDEPVHAWDEAVAFYTGSLEGTDGEGSGKLARSLAQKRCSNFRTCGDLANEVEGTAHVNIQILREFIDGQRKLRAGQCVAVKATTKRIEQLMAIPLVQGTLRYAYFTGIQGDTSEKSEAEGAVFAASVLPLVHACDDAAADTIYQNLKVGQGGTADFIAVKKAFESVYSCMNIRCEDVGGLYDSVTGGYLPQAEPCQMESSAKKDNKVALAVGLSIGGVVLLVALFFVSRKFCGSHTNTLGEIESSNKM